MTDSLLVIDQGNTLTKVMLYVGSHLAECRRLEGNPSDTVLAMAESAGVRAGIYCGVGFTDVKLIESLRRLLDDDFMVLTHSTPVPLDISYHPESSLGLDRVAALVGASGSEIRRPLLVVDAGTAVTSDLLLPSGKFGGGSISPGIRLRLDSLHDHTARLPEIGSQDMPSPVCGHSTSESMLAGCVWGVAMELLGRFRYLEEEADASEMVLTGGDAFLLADRLKTLCPTLPVRVVPDLVGLGLKKIYNHNRTLLAESDDTL